MKQPILKAIPQQMIRFIASRFGTRSESRISRPAVLIATAGVALGLAVMIVTVCVTSGFRSEVHERLREVGGDMQIINTSSLYTSESAPLDIPDTTLDAIRTFPGIERAERIVTKIGCLKTDSAFIGIQLIGIDKTPSAYINTISSDSHITASNNSVTPFANNTTKLADNEIIISTVQAAKMRLQVGDKVMAYFFDNTIRARRFLIIGIYSTHLDDFDATQVFASYSTVHKLTGFTENQCNLVQIYNKKHMTPSNDKALSHPLQLLLHVRQYIPTTPTCQATVMTLDEMYPQIFSWLGLLDLNVWIILILMLCVSGFTMASGLLILILERTQAIGLMKALGARFSTLRQIFLYIAGTILIRGMFIGNILALVLLLVQKQWHIIHLNPMDYYVDAVPVSLPWLDIMFLNIGTLVITISVLIVPTAIINKISPVKAMHFE